MITAAQATGLVIVMLCVWALILIEFGDERKNP